MGWRLMPVQCKCGHRPPLLPKRYHYRNKLAEDPREVDEFGEQIECWETQFYIECVECGARGPCDFGRDYAVAWWNMGVRA